jgi:hypothetical protein
VDGLRAADPSASDLRRHLVARTLRSLAKHLRSLPSAPPDELRRRAECLADVVDALEHMQRVSE